MPGLMSADLAVAPCVQLLTAMRLHIEMTVVADCSAGQCVYNVHNRCHAKAITIGGTMHPACDTYLSSEKHPDLSHTQALHILAGVGACKTIGCKHNQDLQCTASSMRVQTHAAHADCVTFEASAQKS